MSRLLRRVEALGEVRSTMEEARRFPPGTLVVAEAQTRGRGRAGHRWESPPGGLYMTLVLEPAPPAERLALPVAAALAAREALSRRFGVATRVKWPNDLLAGRRKIAGIIAEATGASVLLGAGVNVGAAEAAFPADLRATATSILIETGRSFPPIDVALGIVDELEILYPRWLAADPGLVDLARAALILEHPVRWRAPSGMLYEGAPRGVGPRGELEIETPAGPVTAQAGDLEILWTS
jgi:BirA family biotin operon repressor/biotin-[acetyl-CoA-carboxylase] ligase